MYFAGMKKCLFYIPLVLVMLSCGGQKSTENVPVDDGIPTAPAVSLGMDSSKLNDMTRAIRDGKYSNIHAVLIARHGKLVYEEYFSGEDEIWGDKVGRVDFNRSTLHDLRSISKSVVSACVGIAINQGKLKGVNQNVFDFFPEYAEYKKGNMAKLTIEHLLSMSSGIKWNEDVPYDNPENSEIQMANSKDPAKYVLSQPMDTVPGTVWKYNGGTTQLLAAIIQKVSGQSVDEFARVNLFEPLGIKTFDWIKYPFTTIPAAASGVRLLPRDLLKFGLLYYNGGIWNGKQILSAEWVKTSFETHVSKPNDEGYGYQFWIWNDEYKGAVNRMVIAVGNGNQRIFFNKPADLVVVTLAGDYNQWNLPNHPGKLLPDFIYPAVK
jgi:CubicO group peptidase (beta-lactamase class C family)